MTWPTSCQLYIRKLVICKGPFDKNLIERTCTFETQLKLVIEKRVFCQAFCHGTRGFEPVRHSCISYYESKSSGNSIISIDFTLPWAHQENDSSF